VWRRHLAWCGDATWRGVATPPGVVWRRHAKNSCKSVAS
jgi:hypothetical protein